MTIRISEFMDAVDAADVARLAHNVGLHPGSGDEAGGYADGDVTVLGVAPGLVRIGGTQRTYRLPSDGEDLAFALAMADAARRPGGGRVVTVTGASGGLGVSTFAATFAAAAQEAGESVALVEGDRAAGAVASMLALQPGEGLRWNDVTGSGPVVAQRLLPSLPKWRSVSVLAGEPGEGPSGEAVVSVVGALRRHCTLVVVDLPRQFIFTDYFRYLMPDLTVGLVGATQESLNCAIGLVEEEGWTQCQREQWILRRTSRSAEFYWHASEVLGLWERQLLPLAQERGLADAIAAGDGPWASRRGPLRMTAARVLSHLEAQND